MYEFSVTVKLQTQPIISRVKNSFETLKTYTDNPVSDGNHSLFGSHRSWLDLCDVNSKLQSQSVIRCGAQDSGA